MLEGSAPSPREQRGQQRGDGNADLEALEILDAVELPARGRGDLAEAVVPDFLHRHDPGLADGVADDLADAAIHRGPDLVVGPEGKADARQTRQRHQHRQRQAGRRQQFDAAGANLRQHLGIAAELAVGKTVTLSRPDDCVPISRGGLDQPKRQGMGIGRIDAQFEVELGGRAGWFGRGLVAAQAADAAPSKPLRVIFIFCCLPSALARLAPVSAEPPRPQDGRGKAPGQNLLPLLEIPANETILGNPRNPPETRAGVHLCQQRGGKDARRLT